MAKCTAAMVMAMRLGRAIMAGEGRIQPMSMAMHSVVLLTMHTVTA